MLRAVRVAGSQQRAWVRALPGLQPVKAVRMPPERRTYGHSDDRLSSETSAVDLEKLAELSQLGITKSEAEAWRPKIADIIKWFDQLQQVDLEGVPPALRASLEKEDTLRQDDPSDFEER
jgi:aspartyl/glutamyl-tRNA(Asn/Gln) amidotransferase C subunit